MSGYGWICLSCLAPWRQSEARSVGDTPRLATNRHYVASAVDTEMANDRAMIARRKPQEPIECGNATEAWIS
jgi:hypothetical protein